MYRMTTVWKFLRCCRSYDEWPFDEKVADNRKLQSTLPASSMRRRLGRHCPCSASVCVPGSSVERRVQPSGRHRHQEMLHCQGLDGLLCWPLLFFFPFHRFVFIIGGPQRGRPAGCLSLSLALPVVVAVAGPSLSIEAMNSSGRCDAAFWQFFCCCLAFFFSPLCFLTRARSGISPGNPLHPPSWNDGLMGGFFQSRRRNIGALFQCS